MVEVVAQYELRELGIVYAEAADGTRYFVDADSLAPRPLTAGQVLQGEVTDEGHIVSTHE